MTKDAMTTIILIMNKHFANDICFVADANLQNSDSLCRFGLKFSAGTVQRTDYFPASLTMYCMYEFYMSSG